MRKDPRRQNLDRFFWEKLKKRKKGGRKFEGWQKQRKDSTLSKEKQDFDDGRL